MLASVDVASSVEVAVVPVHSVPGDGGTGSAGGARLAVLVARPSW